MNDLMFVNKKPWLSALLVILLILVWQWFSLGAGRSDKQTLPAPLQEHPVSSAQDAAAVIIEKNLWEPDRKPGQEREQASAVQNTAALEEKNWQLLALAMADDYLIAYIGDKSDPASFKKYIQGDLLPDGKTILKIEYDRVTYGAQSEVGTSEIPNVKEPDKVLFLFGRTSDIGDKTSE